MAKEMKKVKVVKLADGRFTGVAEAAAALGVRKQTVYMYVGGWPKALGAEKRARLVIVDRSRGVRV